MQGIIPQWIKEKLGATLYSRAWLTGTAALTRLGVCGRFSDWDIFIEDFTPEELKATFGEQASGTTYFGGLVIPSPEVSCDTQPMDIWGDTPMTYVNEVPVDLWGVAVKVDDGTICAGPNFFGAFQSKMMDFPNLAILKTGRVVSPQRLAYAIGKFQARYGYGLGPNIQAWLPLNTHKQ